MRDDSVNVKDNAAELTQEICLQKLRWIEEQLQIAPPGWEHPTVQRLLESQYFFSRALARLRRRDKWK